MTKEELRTTWADRIAAFKASGQSVPKWCAGHGIKPHQLRYWLKKESQASADIADGSPQWLPLNINELGASPVVIKIRGAVIEVQPGFDPELLLSVVKTLSRL